MLTRENISRIKVKGVPAWRFVCPECGTAMVIDDEHFNGLKPIGCPNDQCSFVETNNLSILMDEE